MFQPSNVRISTSTRSRSRYHKRPDKFLGTRTLSIHSRNSQLLFLLASNESEASTRDQLEVRIRAESGVTRSGRLLPTSRGDGNACVWLQDGHKATERLPAVDRSTVFSIFTKEAGERQECSEEKSLHAARSGIQIRMTKETADSNREKTLPCPQKHNEVWGLQILPAPIGAVVLCSQTPTLGKNWQHPTKSAADA